MRGAAGSLGGLDRFRVIAALLVAAIHTGPLLTLSGDANFILTDILARLAVPFFFAVSGYFLLPKLRRDGAKALWPFVRKVLFLYGISILLYLPLMAYNGYFQGPGLAGKLLRDIAVNGPFYHLWYFPAAALGACVACALARRAGYGPGMAVCALLYLLGLLGDSYDGLTAALPPLRALYQAYFSLFDYTRNGLFFAPLFLLLGGVLAERPPRHTPRRYAAGLCLALSALLCEGLLVERFSLARHDSMYLALPLCLWSLLRVLTAVKCKPLPALRTLSTVVYIVHPLCIVLVRGGAKALGLLSADGFLLGNSLLHYLAVVAVSCAAALPFIFLKGRGAGPGPGPQGPDRQAPRPRAWAEIDLDALRHNVRALRALSPQDCALMAVVKADAYGHGAVPVARACREEGVAAFAVATAAEGAALREAGIQGEILVLSYTAPELSPLLAKRRLTQTVLSDSYARDLDAQGHPISVHIAVDTGMHRLGIPWDDAKGLTSVFACQNLRVTGLFTHLSDAETLAEEGQARTEEQVRRFYRAAELVERAGHEPGKLHIQSSYGLLNYSGLACSYARIGIALYGVMSGPHDRTRVTPALRGVLSLRARVAQVRPIETGERAGYDGCFTASRPTVLATLAIGYADGYPRALSCGVGRVLLHGQYAPVAGLICMDQLLVDATGIPGVEEGDTATLIGRDGGAELTAQAVAEAAGTITNELLSRLGPRVERVAV